MGDKCGAVSTLGTDEYSFNCVVAEHLKKLLTDSGLTSEVLTSYPYKGYSAAMKWVGDQCERAGAKAAIELHFNSSSRPSASGHEWLIYFKSKAGRQLAECFNSAMITARPKAAKRGIVELSSTSNRGFGFVHMTPCPSVVLEPFFGSNASEAQEIIPHPEVLAGIYHTALTTYFATQP